MTAKRTGACANGHDLDAFNAQFWSESRHTWKCRHCANESERRRRARRKAEAVPVPKPAPDGQGELLV